MSDNDSNDSQTATSNTNNKYQSVEKSYLDKVNAVKTNLIKMLVNRNFIDKKNESTYIKNLIKDTNDDMEFMITLDHDKNYNTEIPNKRIYIKFIDEKITSINKTSTIGEFIKQYYDDYKIAIAKDSNIKIEKQLETEATQIEIIEFDRLQINIADHDIFSQHIVLTKEEGLKMRQEFNAQKKDMPYMKSTDAAAKYYGMKPGDIARIIRPSVLTAETIAYRYVIKSSDTKIKT